MFTVFKCNRVTCHGPGCLDSAGAFLAALNRNSCPLCPIARLTCPAPALRPFSLLQVFLFLYYYHCTASEDESSTETVRRVCPPFPLFLSSLRSGTAVLCVAIHKEICYHILVFVVQVIFSWPRGLSVPVAGCDSLPSFSLASLPSISACASVNVTLLFRFQCL
jgi:hypothetical protein